MAKPALADPNTISDEQASVAQKSSPMARQTKLMRTALRGHFRFI
jgi:hypothetical protein